MRRCDRCGLSQPRRAPARPSGRLEDRCTDAELSQIRREFAEAGFTEDQTRSFLHAHHPVDEQEIQIMLGTGQTLWQVRNNLQTLKILGLAERGSR